MLDVPIKISIWVPCSSDYLNVIGTSSDRLLPFKIVISFLTAECMMFESIIGSQDSKIRVISAYEGPAASNLLSSKNLSGFWRSMIKTPSDYRTA